MSLRYRFALVLAVAVATGAVAAFAGTIPGVPLAGSIATAAAGVWLGVGLSARMEAVPQISIDEADYATAATRQARDWRGRPTGETTSRGLAGTVLVLGRQAFRQSASRALGAAAVIAVLAAVFLVLPRLGTVGSGISVNAALGFAAAAVITAIDMASARR